MLTSQAEPSSVGSREKLSIYRYRHLQISGVREVGNLQELRELSVWDWLSKPDRTEGVRGVFRHALFVEVDIRE